MARQTLGAQRLSSGRRPSGQSRLQRMVGRRRSLKGLQDRTARGIDSVEGMDVDGAMYFLGLLMRKDAAYLLHGLARPDVVAAYMKPDHLGPAEGVLKHQVLQLPIGVTAPATTAEESEADRNFSPPCIPLVEAGGSNDLAGRIVGYDQRPLGTDGTCPESAFEDITPIAERIWMLLPYERVCRCRIDGLEIFLPQRTESDRVANKRWYEVKAI